MGRGLDWWLVLLFGVWISVCSTEVISASSSLQDEDADGLAKTWARIPAFAAPIGDPIFTRGRDTSSQCAQDCESDDQCKSFQFSRITKTCRLFKGRIRISTNIDYYQRKVTPEQVEAQQAQVHSGRISDKVASAQKDLQVHKLTLQTAQHKMEHMSEWSREIKAKASAADEGMALQAQHMEANHRILHQRQAELAVLLSKPGARPGGSPEINLADQKLKSQERRVHRGTRALTLAEQKADDAAAEMVAASLEQHVAEELVKQREQKVTLGAALVSSLQAQYAQSSAVHADLALQQQNGVDRQAGIAAASRVMEGEGSANGFNLTHSGGKGDKLRWKVPSELALSNPDVTAGRKIGTVDLNTCALECKNSARCLGFFFRVDTSCFILYSLEARTTEAFGLSFTKLISETSHTAVSRVALTWFNHVPFFSLAKPSVLRELPGTDADECAEQCIPDLECKSFQVSPAEHNEPFCQLLTDSLHFGGESDYFERYSGMALDSTATSGALSLQNKGNKTIHWSKLNIDFNSSSCPTLHKLRNDTNDKIGSTSLLLKQLTRKTTDLTRNLANHHLVTSHLHRNAAAAAATQKVAQLKHSAADGVLQAETSRLKLINTALTSALAIRGSKDKTASLASKYLKRLELEPSARVPESLLELLRSVIAHRELTGSNGTEIPDDLDAKDKKRMERMSRASDMLNTADEAANSAATREEEIVEQKVLSEKSVEEAQQRAGVTSKRLASATAVSDAEGLEAEKMEILNKMHRDEMREVDEQRQQADDAWHNATAAKAAVDWPTMDRACDEWLREQGRLEQFHRQKKEDKTIKETVEKQQEIADSNTQKQAKAADVQHKKLVVVERTFHPQLEEGKELVQHAKGLQEQALQDHDQVIEESDTLSENMEQTMSIEGSELNAAFRKAAQAALSSINQAKQVLLLKSFKDRAADGLSKRVKKQVDTALQRGPKLEAAAKAATNKADTKLDQISAMAKSEADHMKIELKSLGKKKARDDPVLKARQKERQAAAKLDSRATFVSKQIADIERKTSLEVARFDESTKTDLGTAEKLQDEVEDRIRAPPAALKDADQVAEQHSALDKSIAVLQRVLGHSTKLKDLEKRKNQVREQSQNEMESALQKELDRHVKIAAEQALQRLAQAEEASLKQQAAEAKLHASLGDLADQLKAGEVAAKEYAADSVNAKHEADLSHQQEVSAVEQVKLLKAETGQLQGKAAALDLQYKEKSAAVLSGIATMKVEEELTQLSKQQKIAHRQVEKAMEMQTTAELKHQMADSEALVLQCKVLQDDGLVRINQVWSNLTNGTLSAFDDAVLSIKEGVSSEIDEQQKAKRLAAMVSKALSKAKEQNSLAVDELNEAKDQAKQMNSKETADQKRRKMHVIKEKIKEIKAETKRLVSDANAYEKKVVADAETVAERKMHDVRHFTASLKMKQSIPVTTHNNTTLA